MDDEIGIPNRCLLPSWVPQIYQLRYFIQTGFGLLLSAGKMK